MTDPLPPIRHAATVIILRQMADGPAVLMGQRGAKAAFMPNKFVFPGGAVDAGDTAIPLARPLAEPCATRLTEDSDPALANALAAAAIRELWEEAGLRLSTQKNWDAPSDWDGFAEGGHAPDASALRFFFRAITPPGKPRRFDARFFLISAEALSGDLDDFAAASDELSHLQWVPLATARSFDLPFITEVVLAELTTHPDPLTAPETVPFFKNDDESELFARLGR